VRRFIPKGSDISKFIRKQIAGFKEWINSDSRKIVGSKSAKGNGYSTGEFSLSGTPLQTPIQDVHMAEASSAGQKKRVLLGRNPALHKQRRTISTYFPICSR
jgi:hypothetical protein